MEEDPIEVHVLDAHVTEDLLDALSQFELIGLEGMITLTQENAISDSWLREINTYGQDIPGLETSIDNYKPHQEDVYDDFEERLREKARTHIRQCGTCLVRYLSVEDDTRERLLNLASDSINHPILRKVGALALKSLEAEAYVCDFLGVVE